MRSDQGRWPAQQLAEFVALVSSFSDAGSAMRGAVEWVAGTFEAEVAAVVNPPSVEASIGVPASAVPELLEVAAGARDVLDIEGVASCGAVAVPLGDARSGRFVLARSQPAELDAHELELLRASAAVLGMTVERLRALANERTLRERSERERVERERVEGNYRKLVERLPAVVYIADVGEHGAWRYVSPQVQTILGFLPSEWIADPDLWMKRLHPEDRERVLADERAVFEGQSTMPPGDYRMVARDGRVIWFMDDAVLEHDEHGNRYWHGVLYDITDRKRAEMELKVRAAQQAAVAQLGEQALEGADLADLMNTAVAAAAEILGVEYGSVLELLSDHDSFILRAGVGWPEGASGSMRLPAGTGSHAGFVLERGMPVIVNDWTAEQRFERPIPRGEEVRSGMAVRIDGQVRPFGVFELQSTHMRVFSSDDVNFVQSLANVLADAIDRRAAEDEIRHQAVHDPLTRLPNRVLFLDRLAHALAHSRRRNSKVAMLFLDLDHFKLINDSLGHAAGDDLLTAVAPRLKQALRPGDTVARFGGDEFGILIEDMTDERDAVSVAEHIGAVFTRPFVLKGVEHFLTASIGIAVAHDGNERPHALIRDADAAMYRAKERGRGRYELFDQVMRARAVERLQLENELRRALGRDELIVHYQPVVSLRTGEIVAVEALIRWQHPGRGLILPEEFIPVAEQTGLIEPIGRWVLEESCRQTVEWHNAQPDAPPIGVSVNLSARQVAQRDLPEMVAEVLTSSGIDPASLSLEITESALVEDSEGPVETVRQLKAMGVRLVIDDFGTGYSSLSYLQRFPLDTLKIDRSFVEGLGEQQESSAIVNAIVAMAGALSIDVTAEGVETEVQLGELQRLGCTYGQGYYFAGALPGAAISKMLSQRYLWQDRLGPLARRGQAAVTQSSPQP